MEYVIDRLRRDDWEQVREIYRQGIATGNATFETQLPDWHEWNAAHLPAGRIVARAGEMVLGWAALSPVSSRLVYTGVAEVSLYVSASARGRGIGRGLLSRLVEESEAQGVWTLQSGILPENRASLHIHESCGFREVGRREKLGKLNGTWRDVVVMERRSRKVGTD